MSAPAKPVDLEAARDLAKRLVHFDMPGTAETIRDMADEIERANVASLDAAAEKETADHEFTWLKKLAREGWERAAQAAHEASDDEAEAYAKDRIASVDVCV